MKFFDTHCHLNLEPLKDQFDQIITELKRQNCYANIVGIDLESSLAAVELATKSEMLFCTIGIHPTEVHKLDNESEIIAVFENLLKNKNKNKIIAIGETGFDFFHFSAEEYTTQKQVQEKWLRIHSALAKKYDLPLILHVRDAHAEMLVELQQNQHYGIIHCFTQNYEIAQQYLSLTNKWFLSIPGVLTFKKAIDIQEAVKQISLNKLLIETDAPWLAPMPYRGKTNYPQYSLETLKKIAELKSLDLTVCAEQIFANTLEIFKLNKENLR
ncbi:TatD DNase family protein [Mycoplasmoides fastidiosum]|uniref:TatD DNase family protein n=1 Tax=Mycoplasmoides fastidiosum TaxID=92758 RepID=A0ABU0LYQ4_9BACT|nr:TatD family hydrolase [Mycoplasmoides fastidiosum]MDQ0513824.1 TatD DNase family protein [Mycoplasmoides fastidiosum]UUD37759.1 TatD family hydrolase [Mycoplasmoides fastidiosum]